MNVKGMTAIVTGGASGLGEACVRDLVRGGAKVAIFDSAADRGERIAAELDKNVVFAHADVTREESLRAAVDKTLDAFGAIHIVINCAGTADAIKVHSEKRGPHSMAAFSRMLSINLAGTFNVICLAVEKMIENTPNGEGEKGVIINTASTSAFDGQIGQAAYSASKAGIVGMTLPIARECAEYGIRVVTIAPGIFDTPLLALLPESSREALRKTVPFPSRMGRTEEFAALARHIIENPMLNGEVIRLDGGLRMAAR